MELECSYCKKQGQRKRLSVKDVRIPKNGGSLHFIFDCDTCGTKYDTSLFSNGNGKKFLIERKSREIFALTKV